MRRFHDCKFYIPAGSVRVADRASSAVAYIYERAGVPYAVAFAGKAQKPAWHFRFRSEASRESRVRAFFAATAATEQRRVARRAERAAFVHPFKAGDVFSTCWGYDQTNREYYQCVEVRGKHLIVREIASGYVETQWLAGIATPMPGAFVGEPARVLAQPGGFRCPRYGHWASYDAPKLVGGVPTYAADHVSHYH